jgi:hypothetical protein
VAGILTTCVAGFKGAGRTRASLPRSGIRRIAHGLAAETVLAPGARTLGSARVALCLASLSARSHMSLNRRRLGFLELPSGDVLNRTRTSRLAPAGDLGLGSRCRGLLVGCGDSSRSLLTLRQLVGQDRRFALETEKSHDLRQLGQIDRLGNMKLESCPQGS